MKYPKKDLQRMLFRLLIQLQHHQYQEAGYSLVITIGMILILTSLLVTASIMGKIESSSTTSVIKSSKGFYAAEAGLNRRAALIRDKFEGFGLPSGDSPNTWEDCADSNGANDGSDDLICDSMTLQKQDVFTYVDDVTSGGSVDITIPQDELFGGLSAQEYQYDLYSTAVDSQKQPTAILKMKFRSRLIPLFQFLSFYNKDLELGKPPNMNLNGPMHANGNMYINASATLSINGQMSASGTFYRGEKYNNNCSGTVNVYDPSNPRTVTCPSGNREEFTVSNTAADWNGEIQFDVSELTVPTPDDFDPTPGKPYWDNADLRIVLDITGSEPSIEVRDVGTLDYGATDATNTSLLLDTCPAVSTTLNNDPDASTTELTVVDTSGFTEGDVIRVGSDDDTNVITNVGTNTITLKYALGTDPSLGDSVRKSIVSTTDKFYNNRENAPVRMLDVDVQGLFNCAASQDIMGKELDDDTDGGLVWHFTVEDGSGGTANTYGIRFRNGSQLASTVGGPAIKGLTIVSDQAVYILGDYNNIDNKPASFLADTINVLSNSWKILTDEYSQPENSVYVYGGGDRDASDTTVYAAFLSGTDTTGDSEGAAGEDQGFFPFPSSYGGGFENYPRFHENWYLAPNPRATFTYRGSFVTLGAPRKATGKWCGTGNSCNIYMPPHRNWDFDTSFTDAANLPPMTPRAVYLVQELFQRDFDRPASHPQGLKIATLVPFNFLSMLPPFRLKL